MKPVLRYDSSSSTAEQIRAHLSRCDELFRPPLSSRLDIAEYALKLRNHARTFEAWDGESLIGLVAMYVNPANCSAFITNVSVDPLHKDKGLASRLLADAIGFARNRGVVRISLEVSRYAAKAIRLYSSHGFIAMECGGPIMSMQLEFPGGR